jgi:hypothetical protein
MGVVLLRKISHFSVALVVFASISRATRGVRGVTQKSINVTDLAEEVHVAICTDSLADDRSNMLLDRVRRLGYTPHWLNCSDAFQNKTSIQWGKRLQHYQKFVEELLEPRSESHVHDPLVIFVDGMDVLAEGSAAEAAARFQDYGTPVVLSCVSYPYPPDCEAYSRFNLSGTCNYPSGGAYMGRATGLRKLFRQGGTFHAKTDDQCWLFSAAYEHLKVDDDYKFDKESHLFLSYTNSRAWLWSYALEHGRHTINMPDMDSSPTFIHLDSSHARTEVMRKLEECLPGSTEPMCNRRVGGWWPQPRDVRWIGLPYVVVYVGLAMREAMMPVLPFLLVFVFALAFCVFRRNCHTRKHVLK